MAKPRPRGRAYACACGEEKLRLTRRGPDARHEGWSYLWGQGCDGGVKLRFDGVKVVEVRPVPAAEVARIKALPARRVDAVDAALATLEERHRVRLGVIESDVRGAIQAGMEQWLVIGERLSEAKALLPHGAFGPWVERNGMDRINAFKFITAWETVHAAPAQFQKQFLKMGQEKTVLLTRLSPPKRLEILEHGVPIGGELKPLEDVRYREFNAYVRSVVGTSARGRKAKDRDNAPAPKERFGMPAAIAQPFADALRNLHAIKALVTEDRIPKKHTITVGQLWRRIYNAAYKLHTDHGLGDIVDYAS